MTDNTRDIAVATAAQMKSHVDDCFEVRKRNEAMLAKIDKKIDSNSDALDRKIDNNAASVDTKIEQVMEKLDKLIWYVLPILGGVILLAHMPDWIMAFVERGK